MNGEIRGEKIVTRSFVNLGIAVSLEDGKGLIVPVIRNAQDLNLLGLARAIAELAEKARTKKLLPDDVQGGTFTITNPGGYGTFHGTPVISQPQAAILGTYALVKRPWVVQDELGQDVIAIRPMMNITLTYDHRLVDGAYAGASSATCASGWKTGTTAPASDAADRPDGRLRGCGSGDRLADRRHSASAEREGQRFTDESGTVTHAELERDGAIVMLATPNADYQGPKRHRETCEAARRWQDNPWVIDGLFVNVDDIDAHHARAAAAGATIIRPLDDVGVNRDEALHGGGPRGSPLDVRSAARAAKRMTVDIRPFPAGSGAAPVRGLHRRRGQSARQRGRLLRRDAALRARRHDPRAPWPERHHRRLHRGRGADLGRGEVAPLEAGQQARWPKGVPHRLSTEDATWSRS